MPSSGDAFSCSSKISLCSYRVLIVAEMVSHIRQKLNKHNPHIRGVTFLPIGNNKRQSIKQQSAKTRIVFCQIVHGWLEKVLLRTLFTCTIKITWLIILERKRYFEEDRIKIISRKIWKVPRCH